ncbi:MAG TPA: hypothetical protein VJN68_16215 [Burkholderiaceae bacterium]|nr:hypothetical protein [Burkholderiaceae bacterium]
MMAAVVHDFCCLELAAGDVLRLYAEAYGETYAEIFGWAFDGHGFALVEDAAGALIGLWQAIRIYAQSRDSKSSSMVPP